MVGDLRPWNLQYPRVNAPEDRLEWPRTLHVSRAITHRVAAGHLRTTDGHQNERQIVGLGPAFDAEPQIVNSAQVPPGGVNGPGSGQGGGRDSWFPGIRPMIVSWTQSRKFVVGARSASNRSRMPLRPSSWISSTGMRTTVGAVTLPMRRP